MKKQLFTLLSLSLSLLTTCAEQANNPLESFNAQLSALNELPKEITPGRLQAITQLNSSLINAANGPLQTITAITIVEDISALVEKESVLIATALADSIDKSLEGVSESDFKQPGLIRQRSNEEVKKSLPARYSGAIHDLQQTVSSIGEKVLDGVEKSSTSSEKHKKD